MPCLRGPRTRVVSRRSRWDGVEFRGAVKRFARLPAGRFALKHNGAMSTSAPEVTAPVTFPEKLVWLQRRIQTHVRPYHLAMGAVVGLITVVFLVVIVLMILVATNFNVLGWIE